MNPKNTLVVSIAVLAMLLSGTGLKADVATFQNDGTYTGTEDTQMSDGARNNNYGASTYGGVSSHSWSGPHATNLIRFDLSSLSSVAGLQISQAVLTLEVNYESSAGNLTVNLHEVLAANAGWVEGTGDAAAVTGAACWDYRAYDAASPTDWASGTATTSGVVTSGGCSGLGTDVETNAAAPGVVINGTGSYSWTVSDDATGSGLLNSMEAWANGTANAGMLFRGVSSSGSCGLNFRSSEYWSATVRPKLEITYTPEPATMTLLLLGLPLALRRRRK